MPQEPEQVAVLLRVLSVFAAAWFAALFAAVFAVRKAGSLRVALSPEGRSFDVAETRPSGALVLFALFAIIFGEGLIANVVERSQPTLAAEPTPTETYDRKFTTLAGGLIGKALIICVIGGVSYALNRASGGRETPWRGFEPLPRDLAQALIVVALAVPPLLFMQAGLQALFFGENPVEHPYITLMREIAAHDQGDRLAKIFTLAATSAVVAAPILEELFFRGLLQGWLRRVLKTDSAWPAILLTSAAFSLAHYSHGPAPIPLFFFSLLLGWLYESTGRLAPSILAHACFNGVSAALLWLQITGRIAVG